MLEKLFNSVVIDADDAALRHYTHEHPKVFAKFTVDDCATCQLLAPGFLLLADNEAYDDILFVRLDSNENPVAQHLMQQRAAPFFVSYCQGRLLECETRETDAAVRAQLERLRAYPVPVA